MSERSPEPAPPTDRAPGQVVDLEAMASAIAAGVERPRTAGRGPTEWRERDLEDVIIEACGPLLGTDDRAGIEKTGNGRRLPLEGWEPYHVDLIARGDSSETWIEVKWAVSGREVWWLAWDALKLAAARRLEERGRPRPSSTLLIAGVPVGVGASVGPWPRADFEASVAALAPVLEHRGEWRRLDVVDEVVQPTLPYWLLCAHENPRTYPRRVPLKIWTRAAVADGVTPGGGAGPKWRVYVVEVGVDADGLAIDMPGSAEAPIVHSLGGQELRRTALGLQPGDGSVVATS